MFITLAFSFDPDDIPRFWRRKAVDRAVVTWIQNPTPENKLAVQVEKNKARHGQYVVCSLAVLNWIGIIVYGGLHQKKGYNPT
ncbi:hypothetical protein [Pedosphaera parvula]|nr:hypothetical protein [Pedosphaera parvula]